MSAQNPDFSLDSKKRIAKTVRRVEAMPADATNVTRPANPMGGGVPKGAYQYQTLQMVTQNEVGWDFDHIHPQVT